jgi:ATP-dependent helicase/DNAse subunit B
MLVFLDIDGVMVPAKSYKQPKFLRDGFAAFSVKATHVLNKLIEHYDATIVLTTSHKSNHSIAQWKQIFEMRGVRVKNIQSLPKNINNLTRKEEILNWANTHSLPEDFIILDDDKCLNELPDYLKDHLILTSSYVGLTNDHLNDVERIQKIDYKVFN